MVVMMFPCLPEELAREDILRPKTKTYRQGRTGGGPGWPHWPGRPGWTSRCYTAAHAADRWQRSPAWAQHGRRKYGRENRCGKRM